MKKILYSIVFMSSVAVFAQTGRVGINTNTPKTSLDVRGLKATDGTSLATDATGFQAPRLTREELTAKGDALYGADQKGALVYITDVTAGNALTQRVNITSVGYYYFDGNVCVGLNGGAKIPAGLYDGATTFQQDNNQYFSRATVIATTLSNINNSNITLKIPSTGDYELAINYAASFLRVNTSQQSLSTTRTTDSLLFPLTVSIYDGATRVSDVVIAKEYFYQDAINGTYEKTISGILAIKSSSASNPLTPGKTYTFRLAVGNGTNGNGNDNTNFNWLNTRIAGEGKVYVK